METVSPQHFSESVRGHVEDGVLVVVLDNPPVNAASADLRTGLMAALDHVSRTEDLIGMVVTGAGRIFVGGADIKEFGKPAVPPILPDILDRLEASVKPVVAAINGAALGGGGEIALACHARIGSAQGKIGFPEVKLGLIPGAGGTQRLPRLVAIDIAMDMIATGRTIDARQALEIGLIDTISSENLVGDAIAHLRAMTKPEPTSRRPVRMVSAERIDEVRHRISAKARGQIAPIEALRLVDLSTHHSYTEGVAEERATFLALRDGPQSAALRYVFFAERAASKIDDLAGIAPRKIGTVAVIGLGLMGAGIATAILDAGYPVIGIDQTPDAASAGKARIEALIDRNLAAGRIDALGKNERLARLGVSSDMNAAYDADLVIEAVFDDMEVKTALFRRLDDIVRPDAILATNTSYLDPDGLAAQTQYPERVIGLHFFSPANIMRLVELVRCARTKPDVLATGLEFVRKLGKLAIVSGVTEGFIGNSIFSAYRRQAEFLLEDGALPAEIDAAMEAYGFAMGPFAVFDMAGLEIAWNRRKRQAATRNPSERYVEIADRLCEAGRLGQRSGRGWYLYTNGKRQTDPEVTAIIQAARKAKGLTPRAIEAPEIVERLLSAMAEEGSRLLAQKVALRASDIDLVMINGYGFPAYKGGPMFAAGLTGNS